MTAGRLSGRIANVTGASRGIGRATARLFAKEGARVALLSRDPASVELVAVEITGAGGQAIGIGCDVGNPAAIDDAVSKVVKAFGTIDILVNDAFDGSVANASILDLSVEQLQRNFDTGPIAHLRLMQACYPYLKAGGEGRVINFGSMTGIVGYTNYGPYSMAKEAVRALTRTAGREWGPDGITVNNVLPVANTQDLADLPPPPNALGRYGDAEADVAPVVLFLASADIRYITGSSLPADGETIIDSAR